MKEPTAARGKLKARDARFRARKSCRMKAEKLPTVVKIAAAIAFGGTFCSAWRISSSDTSWATRYRLHAARAHKISAAAVGTTRRAVSTRRSDAIKDMGRHLAEAGSGRQGSRSATRHFRALRALAADFPGGGPVSGGTSWWQSAHGQGWRMLLPTCPSPWKRGGARGGGYSTEPLGRAGNSALHRRLHADHGQRVFDLLDAVRFLVTDAQGLAFLAQRQGVVEVLVGLVLRLGLVELHAERVALLHQAAVLGGRLGGRGGRRGGGRGGVRGPRQRCGEQNGGGGGNYQFLHGCLSFGSDIRSQWPFPTNAFFRRVKGAGADVHHGGRGNHRATA